MNSSYPEEPNLNRPDPGQQEPGYTDKPWPRQKGEPDVEGPPPELPKLGSLAQTARLKQLNVARGILLVVGVLTIIFNVALMFMVQDTIRKEVDKAVDKELAKRGMGRAMADPVKLKELEDRAVAIGMLICGAAVFLGVLFVIFGLIVKKFPVPVTITSLVLYVGATLLFGLLDPATLAAGAIWKIFFIVALAKAIQSAMAYEKAGREEAGLEVGY